MFSRMPTWITSRVADEQDYKNRPAQEPSSPSRSKRTAVDVAYFTYLPKKWKIIVTDDTYLSSTM